MHIKVICLITYSVIVKRKKKVESIQLFQNNLRKKSKVWNEVFRAESYQETHLLK